MSNLENMAQEYYQKGEFPLALSAWLELAQSNPEKEDYYICAGNCFDAMGNKESAVKCYLKAYKQNKKSLPAISNLATAYYELENLEEAKKYSCLALKDDSKNLSALINLGNVFYCQKKYTEALEYYKKAVEINEDYFVAVINLANTYFDLKDYAASLRYAKQATKLDSKALQAWTLVGNSALETGDYDEALSAFLTAEKIDSADPWIHNYLSQAYQKKSLWKNALENGWQAVEKSGGEESHHINFGYLLYEAKLEKQDSLCAKYVKIWQEKYGENKIVLHTSKALSDGRSEDVAPAEYVRNIFDVFAPDFEQVLHGLEYHAPDLIFRFLQEIYGAKRYFGLRILDAGCGTGLCGKFLKKYASFRGLIGVDLSSGMLKEAAAKKIYNQLICQDIIEHLECQKSSYDLIVAADVFTYIGDMEKLFSALAYSLKKNGRIVFTVSENSINDSDWFLHASGRFLHSLKYVENLLEKNGFLEEKISREKLRNEGDSEVLGYVISAQKRQ